MPNKMLIDASHPEETRVVVVRGNRIEEFDFESQDKKQLKGNIYLARVTRVEPSLQAAFVEYGGNRHGFLAFSEIHPDYYQIPIADRQALLRADAEAAESEEEEEAEAEERSGRGRRRRRSRHRSRDEQHAESDQAPEQADAAADSPEQVGDEMSGSQADLSTTVEDADAEDPQDLASSGDLQGEPVEARDSADDSEDSDEAVATEDGEKDKPSSIAAAVTADTISGPVIEPADNEDDGGDDLAEDGATSGEEAEVESVGAEDAIEEARSRRRPVRRNYKIQEVIKRRQILLVQVVKEERGNKGAALTTYLSLAGRYSVLMPNTARGGGISRKITNAQDRKRLKEVVAELDVPEGMGVILRTAGESRTKAEIKRDFEYLMRLWENVRNLTLRSTAPTLVYEEGSLIKRSVRDLYNKDIDEILVAGEEGYREAKDFMRMLMPSHAKVVQPYRDTVPIFARNGIEAQLDKMLQPQVTLKSGGYIIINQTEALVSIDVNSGRSTREHSIEDTALQTNLEAAEEVARQLRLRDLAGLIVIDFIDMEESRNNRAVEKRLKECLKNDRARIQVGRISHFGLLEMSRQRIRASVLESTMKPCPHCGGTGHVRSDSSVALHIVRSIEEFLLKDSRSNIIVKTPAATALYVLNHKRATLVDIERRFGVTITLEADENLNGVPCVIQRGTLAEKPQAIAPSHPAMPLDEDGTDADAADEALESQGEEAEGTGAEAQSDRRRRRRKRRRSGRDHDQPMAHEADEVHQEADAGHEADEPAEAVAAEAETLPVQPHGGEGNGEGGGRKRRRGKRGGRRNRAREQASDLAGASVSSQVDAEAEGESETAVVAETVHAESAELPLNDEAGAEIPSPEPEAEFAGSDDKADEPAPAELEAAPEEPSNIGAAEAPADPAPGNGATTESESSVSTTHWTRRRPGSDVSSGEPIVVSSEPIENKPKKAGWWQRRGFF